MRLWALDGHAQVCRDWQIAGDDWIGRCVDGWGAASGGFGCVGDRPGHKVPAVGQSKSKSFQTGRAGKTGENKAIKVHQSCCR